MRYHDLAHNSRTDQLLRRPNPISPYKLLVHTSYVDTASHPSAPPAYHFQDRPRAVCHRCRKRPPIRKTSPGLSFQCSKWHIFIRIGLFHSNPQRSTRFAWLVAHVSFWHDDPVIPTLYRSSTRMGRQGDAKLFIRCIQHGTVHKQPVQTSRCPRIPSR